MQAARSIVLNFKFQILDVWGSVIKIEHMF